MNTDKNSAADKIVGSSDVLDVTAGQRGIGPLLADALYERAVGMYFSSLLVVAPVFTGITKQRYDEVIRPEIERLVAEVERLTSNAQVNRPLKAANGGKDEH